MNAFYNMKTLWKLILGFSVVCAIMGAVGWIGVSKTAAVNEMLNTMYERDLTGLSRAQQANINLVQIGRAVRNVVNETDQGEIQRNKTVIDGCAEQFTLKLSETEPTIITPEGKALVARIKETFPLYLVNVNRCIASASDGNPAEARQAVLDGKVHGDRLEKDMGEIAQQKETLAASAYAESDLIYNTSRMTIITFTIIGVVIGLAIGTFIAKVIANPLSKVVQVLRKTAEGDFTSNLDLGTKDEIGQLAVALNEAVTSIRTALQEARSVAFGVASAAQQLSSASEEISSGAQEQASGLEETASSLEEITSTVKQNADNAQQANQLAVGAREVAEKGGRIVGDAVCGMKEINESSKRIADIITTIDEIAFQTNLLALNAAVEAARAGEQGRGFAVVAGEVRNLAQRSAGAAKEIKGMIQDSVQKVENGSQLVNQSGEALDQIVTSVKRVTDIVSEIAAASREQTRGIEQVNKAVAQMDTVTQANASQTEEMSGTAESLASQAEQLQGLVARFKLEEQGRAASTQPRRNAPMPMKKSKPAAAKTAARAKAVSKREERDHFAFEHDFENDPSAELVGAGAGGSHDGFEEF